MDKPTQNSQLNPIPIEKGIFRFITLRSADQLSREQKNIGFIHHPDLEKSLVLDKVKNGTLEKWASEIQDQNYLLTKKNQVFEIATDLFAFHRQIIQNNYTESRAKSTPKSLGEKELLRVWDSLFYGLFTNKFKSVRVACIELLIANHMIRNTGKKSIELKYVGKSLVVIPDVLWKYRERTKSEDCTGEMYGIQIGGVMDFRRLDQELCGYHPGEVSQVINIAAREYQEKHSRNLISSEVSTEQTVSQEIENLSDTNTAIRNELLREVGRVIAQDRAADYGGSFSYGGETTPIQTEIHAGIATSNSSSISNALAKNYAKDVLTRASERVLQGVEAKRATSILKELEENYRHGFDNREGDEAVVLCYRTLVMRFTNRLLNYGRRITCTISVQDPAKNYLNALSKNEETETPHEPLEPETSTGTIPISLIDKEIKSPSDITRRNYQELGQVFGVTMEPPKENEISISRSISPLQPFKHKDRWTHGYDHNILIPDEYEADSVNGNYRFPYKRHSGDKAYYYYNIGGITGGESGLKGTGTGNGSISGVFSVKHTEFVPIQIRGFKIVDTYSLSLTVKAKLKNSVFKVWQQEAYSRLQQGYENQLLAYEQQQDQQNQNIDLEIEDNEDNGIPIHNPATNRRIIREELKKACAQLLMTPFCHQIGEDFMVEDRECEPQTLYRINQKEQYQKYVELVDFFEQVFDWDNAYYHFYPSMWSPKCSWQNKLKISHVDIDFEAFLKAGMAKVVLPIKCQHSAAALMYFQTCNIYLGEDIIIED
ncbi:MAG: hypothetical protein AAFN81_23605, partial [Bacteroidota bacterium]